MTAINSLEYPLVQGYLHHWLVTGPLAVQVENLERFSGAYWKLQVARHYYRLENDLTETPVETAAVKVERHGVGGYEGRWQYVRCQDDHFVDLTAFYHTTHYLCAWAFTTLTCPDERMATLILTTNGPADVWINGTHCHRQEHFYHQIPNRVAFQAHLMQGANEILVRFEEVAARECPFAMALQAPQLADLPVVVRIPTLLDPERRRTLEELFYAAYTKQDVFTREEYVSVHWPENLPVSATISARLHTLARRIYSENSRHVRSGSSIPMGQAYQFPDGEYRLTVMPKPQELHEGNMRITREIPLRLAKEVFSTELYATYAERRMEALKSAAQRSGLNIFAEIAAMGLGWWSRVDTGVILKSLDSINQRADCSDFYLCGLLGMKHRFEQDENYPDALKQPLEDCILNFKYWHDEPGADAMCCTTENHSILFHACEVMAGQLYPDRIFSNNGQTGAWHRAAGEQRALEWLRKRAASGFLEWDSNCYFEEDVLALTHLADFAENQDVWEMAAVVLDKLFFIMAVNSYKGVFGSTHGRTYTPFIKGGRFEATSGMSRLAWGMGCFNDRIMGVVSLALSGYEVPALVGAIAADQPEEMWNREYHAGSEADFKASGSQGSGVNKVTYKTPDGMLCSAQDWRPGQPGYQQHIWQATFGPDAVIYVTHPTCASEEGSHRPNFWHGNAILPRTAQWKDVLVSIHNFPADDWMGFTHAYFPIHAFDEWKVRDGWAFARCGAGYIALTAAQGIELVRQGNNAFRELRSYGSRNVWLAQMGRAALDGTFNEFQEKILALPLAFDEVEKNAPGEAAEDKIPGVRFQTARGQALAFAWEGPLTLDGEEQELSGFKHIENPYCAVDLNADHMDISLGEDMMRLTFEKSADA